MFFILACQPYTEELDFSFKSSADLPAKSQEHEDEENTGEPATEELESEPSAQPEPVEEPEGLGTVYDTAIPEPIIPEDPYCPEGMVSVRDALDEPVYCIDLFEIQLDEEDWGDADQGPSWPNETTTATALSLPKVLPSTYFSWYQAIAACFNAGKYLCSTEEWIDGCDGTYGSGGFNFPYGNNWEEGLCAARFGDEPQIYAEKQLTGNHPECRSAWGTYDQIGNIWEWTDPLILDQNNLPITNKIGASYYSGGGNIQCGNNPVDNHAPEFNGIIGARCCKSPSYENE